jgi:hypothetical protein
LVWGFFFENKTYYIGDYVQESLDGGAKERLGKKLTQMKFEVFFWFGVFFSYFRLVVVVVFWFLDLLTCTGGIEFLFGHGFEIGGNDEVAGFGA